MEAPDKVYVNIPGDYWHPGTDKKVNTDTEYIRKDMVVDAIKLAYGKVSMNPLDCSEAFEELLNKVGYEIH